LTPVDRTLGEVEIAVSVNGASTAPFPVKMSLTTPSLLRFGGGKAVLATHSDYTLVGATSMSAPGYPVTPAKPGETITLWGVGFGLPNEGIVNGSSSQSGSLPGNPGIFIGGVRANVTFAGLVSPGLYQINTTVPESTEAGDAQVSCDWRGWAGVAEGLIRVQR
jgi:uncharacterized protein (TIGR03437 family)